MKKCSKCKVDKEVSEYNRNKSKKDGLATECRSCANIYGSKYRSDNKDKLLESSRDFKNRNRTDINKNNRNRYLIKKLNHDFMEKKREHNRTYKSNNKGKVNSDTANRHANKLKRMCITTKDDQILIRKIYEEARDKTIASGISHHVDHIIPLKGELVSGLHVPSNLQILTEHENCSKNNKFIV